MLLETRVGDNPVVDIAESTKTKNLWTSALKLCAFACLCIVLVLSPEVRALLLDPEAAVLASCLLAIPVAMALIKKRDIVRAMTVTSVPIGITICVYCMFLTLMNLGDPSDLGSLLRQLYAPLAFSLFFSYALKLAEARDHEVPPPAPWWQVVISAAVAVSMVSLCGYLLADLDLTSFFNFRALVFTLSITLACLAYNLDREKLPFSQVIGRAGTLTCIAAAILGIAVYAYVTDPVADLGGKIIGPAVGATFSTMLYGSVLLVAASSCGGVPGTEKEVRDRDWHISEAYVFVTLVLFPPVTVLATLGF
jgi:hypothetical protein